MLRESAGEDQLMELALEAGAEDFTSDEEGFEILTDPGKLEGVHKAIESKGIKTAGAAVVWLPASTVPLSDAKAAQDVNRLIELLEEHDDVKDVYSNAEFPA